jgi:hypothetical protein
MKRSTAANVVIVAALFVLMVVLFVVVGWILNGNL